MQVAEFYNRDFLRDNYVFKKPCRELEHYIDFFWQSNYSFDEDVSIKTFPRLGSTLLINLGNPFTFLKGNVSCAINEPVYYVRNKPITTLHAPGNLLFGVQFTINLPLLFKKTFAPTNEAWPLNKFFEPRTINSMVAENDFNGRVQIIEQVLINRLSDKLAYKAGIINNALTLMSKNANEGYPIKQVCNNIGCSPKTLERYFTQHLNLTPKKAAGIIRARSAIDKYVNSREKFKPHLSGYYDASHFYKQINRFTAG